MVDGVVQGVQIDAQPTRILLAEFEQDASKLEIPLLVCGWLLKGTDMSSLS